jgi:uncharacterized protein YceK
MTIARLTVVSVAVAVALGGCGSIAVTPSGSSASGTAASRGRVDDARAREANHVACLRGNHLAVSMVGGSDLLVGGSVRVHFAPAPEIAQGEQLQAREQGAEVIGSALLYPGSASDAELHVIEQCLAAGVRG